MVEKPKTLQWYDLNFNSKHKIIVCGCHGWAQELTSSLFPNGPCQQSGISASRWFSKLKLMKIASSVAHRSRCISISGAEEMFLLIGSSDPVPSAPSSLGHGKLPTPDIKPRSGDYSQHLAGLSIGVIELSEIQPSSIESSLVNGSSSRMDYDNPQYMGVSINGVPQ